MRSHGDPLTAYQFSFILCYFSCFVLCFSFINWLNIFHLIFWIFSYYTCKTQILYLFFFILARVNLFLYVNFWSCLWVHWVNWCQLTAACRAHPLKVLWVNKCGCCLQMYAYCVLLVILKGEFGQLGTEIVVNSYRISGGQCKNACISLYGLLEKRHNSLANIWYRSYVSFTLWHQYGVSSYVLTNQILTPSFRSRSGTQGQASALWLLRNITAASLEWASVKTDKWSSPAPWMEQWGHLISTGMNSTVKSLI